MANVTAAEVRYKLRTLSSSVDISDDLLSSASYIPTGDAWIAKILSNNSAAVFASLSDTDKALAKAAELAFIAKAVINSAPVEDHEAGPIKVKDITGSTKKAIIEMLDKEITGLFEILGYTINSAWYVDSQESSLYATADEISEIVIS